MKKIYGFLTAVAVLAAVTIFNACGSTDKCESVNCGLNGVCNDGTCVCDAGYEGTNCETETRKKYLGIANVGVGLCTYADTCLQKTENLVCPAYTSNITANATDARKFNISNFANLVDNSGNPLNLVVGATVKSSTEVTLDEINVPGQGSLKGSGVYVTSPNRLILTYEIKLNCEKTVERDTFKF